jgi:hypothetical protein
VHYTYDELHINPKIMTFTDWLRIVHPFVAGVVIYFAWQTRQRRLQMKAGEKSNISPKAGLEHVNIGKCLTGAVTGIALLGMIHPIFKTIIKKQTWITAPGQVIFIVLMFTATFGSLILLYRAKSKGWRAIFAALTSAGLIILGLQDGIYRRTEEWFFSHYYYGVTVAILMIISLTILPEIYRSFAWRRIHIILNTIALMLFLGQSVTGVRDLLEIPISWQESTIFSCDFQNQVCGKLSK